MALRDAGGCEPTSAIVFEEMAVLSRVMAHLPHVQPFALVAADGRVLAANRPLLELLGCAEHELVGQPWRRYLPGWGVRPRPGAELACFEEWLLTRRAGSRRAHLLVDAVGAPDSPTAYAVFVTGLSDGGAARERPRLGAAAV